MSLLGSTSRMFVGHEQADCAALSANGIDYRCYVWLSRVDWAIEARCVRVLPSGDEVDVFHNVIARATSTEITDTNGVPLDSPKIIAVGTTFVVHWLQASDTVQDTDGIHRDWALYRSLMAMTSFSSTSWSAQGSVALLQEHMLYDVAPVIGTSDFVVTRCTALRAINVTRYTSPYSWVDTVWANATVPTQDVAPMVLGIYAHSSDNDVVFSYQWAQAAGGGLYSRRLNASNGLSLSAEVLMFPQLEADGDTAEDNPHWVQVGHCRTAANRVAVVGECQTATNAAFTTTVATSAWIHHIAYRQINSATAARVGNEHWCPNLYMASRPWSYASGTSVTSPSLDVYCTFTYRSCTEQQEWAQAYAYVCNLDFVMWDQVADGQGLRPRPIVTITGDSIGIPDARASGWQAESAADEAEIVHQGGPTKRRNHVPYPSAAPTTGPDVKTRTVPMTFFATIGTVSDVRDADGDAAIDDVYQSTQPDWAGVRGIVVHLENPWTVYRDSTDPTQPIANFSGPCPRAMHQSVPWGRGLFVAGGTPQLYDGEVLVEVGYPCALEILDYSTQTNGEIGHNDPSNTTTLTDPNGTYNYYVAPDWIDRQGQLHPGPPSNVVAITMPNSDDAVLLNVRCINLSLKDASAFYARAQSIAIGVYRTENGGSQFKRCYGVLVPAATIAEAPRDTPVNDPESFRGWTDVLDGASDLWIHNQGDGPYQLDTNNLLVATNGPTPIVWPACHSPALHQNRIVVADALDPSRFIYSDENIPAAGAATYAAPVIGSTMFFRTGEVRETCGFQSIGPLMYQWTRDSIYALSGTDAGSGLMNWTSNIVHESLGCVDPKTIVLFPLGIGFQSRKGYYVLARSGEASYGMLERSRDQPKSLAGAAVEDDIAEAGNIRSASHSPSEHRIDLVCNGVPSTVTTWVITIDDAQPGTWTINGLSLPVTVQASSQDTAESIGEALRVRMQNLIDAEPPDSLQFEVDSVDALLGVVTVVLLADVDVTLTGTTPGSMLFDSSTAMTTRPRVLRYHYDVEQWSRADLVQTNTNTRLAELVDGCYWTGDAGPRHVVLAQGGVLIERLATDVLAYADQTSVANVGIPIDLTTSWIHLAGVAGAQVLDEIVVQTERDEAGAVEAILEYDFDGAYTGQTMQPTTYTWSSPAPADMRVRPRYRRGRAFRLRVHEGTGVTTAGATMSIVGFTVVIGVQPGVAKTRSSQRGVA